MTETIRLICRNGSTGKRIIPSTVKQHVLSGPWQLNLFPLDRENPGRCFRQCRNQVQFLTTAVDKLVYFPRLENQRCVGAEFMFFILYDDLA